MKTELKLLIAALLSLSMGVAFAAPLLVADMTIVPWTGLPHGPSADFAVNVVYANFSIQDNAVPKHVPPGGPSSYSLSSNVSLVNYFVILNVTNLSNFTAKVGMLSFGAAEDITVQLSALGGATFNPTREHGGQISTSGSTIEGIWLDNQWINVTWIPGNASDRMRLPGIFDDQTKGPSQWTYSKTIPQLPADALETGYFMGGLPIKERTETSGNKMTFYTAVYINGSWVDVTGRLRVNYPKPHAMGQNALMYETLHVVSDSYNNTLKAINVTAPWMEEGMSVVWASSDGLEGFNKYWQPNESRLIVLEGNREVGDTGGLQALRAEDLMFYSAVNSYLKDWKEMTNETRVNTYATSYKLQQVHLEQNQNSYVYNTILGTDQMFQPDPYGVEVFVKPRS